MIRRHEGSVALVTGSGQGIGRGCAHALANDGATVVLLGRTASKLQLVAEELRAGGAAAPLVIRADVGDEGAVRAAVEEIQGSLGRLDTVINSAQSFVFRMLDETAAEDLEVAYRSGAIGTFNVMKATRPLLRERGGAVINFGTSSALTGEPLFASYAMAKEAIRALTRVAASEWGPDDIRVNCICPTAASPAYEEWAESNPDTAERLANERPLGRMGDPLEDIGRAVSALAGDEFRYLTGATLMLNGGRVFLG